MIRILVRGSGKGVLRDAEIVAGLLRAAGYAVCVAVLPTRWGWDARAIHWLERQALRAPGWLASALVYCRWWRGVCRFGQKVETNIFLETVFPSWLATGRQNFLIPNQEWFRPGLVPWLPFVDLVLCKTREAEGIFSKLGCPTAYTGFTSLDRCLPDVDKDYTAAMHFAAPGLGKGTELLLSAWANHPKWPVLWVTSRRGAVIPEVANIKSLGVDVSDAALQVWQNRAGYYIGPSAAEGFGHAFVEAMSCGAIVVTTDGPPMNEIVTPERGALVPVERIEPARLGRAFHCSAQGLEATLAQMFAEPPAQVAERSAQARRWFVDNDAFFRREFLRVFAERVAKQCR